MTVFFNHMKRILKSKAHLAIMLILPLLPVVPIAMGSATPKQVVTVGIVDEDHSTLSAAFTDALKNSCEVLDIKKDNIEKELLDSNIFYAVVIENGFAQRMIQSGDSMLTGYTKSNMDLTSLIRSYSDGFLGPVRMIAAASGGNSDAFYKGLKNMTEGNITIVNEPVSIPDTKKSNAAWGMIIQFMMFSSVFSATILIADKENKTFFRTLSASIRLKSYMFQSILSFLVLAVMQIIFLLAVTVGGLGVYPGSSVINMFIVLTVFSLVSISMGVAISSYSRNAIQASISGAGIVVLMCLLGGAWGAIPLSGMIRNLSKLMPVTWVVEIVDKLLKGGSLASNVSQLGILLLFAAVFFLLGTWRKADIAK